MGLDTPHGCGHGAYSAFMRWRQKIAEVAGMPPLMLMENFYREGSLRSYAPGAAATYELEEVEKCLPIKWDALRPSPLHILLNHSDCDGEILAKDCGSIADALEALLPLLDGDGGGHIGGYREKTQAFIDGLRRASAAGENVEFH